MAVNINVPSQVKTYANLAAFPASGSLKTIYIAEDTNKTYRWTGSVYVEISASAAMTWGQIGGTLSNQTDLQNALDAKVPTSRTLTINGVTQDLSADRTFTISTGITIGSTAIASGVVGRVLFEGAGNVVQESSSLFWDSTNNRLGIGTDTPAHTFQVYRNTSAGYLASFNSGATLNTNASLTIRIENANLPSIQGLSPGAGGFNTFAINPLGGNLLIGTTTDAGFKLDVNGTARVQDSATIIRAQNAATSLNIQNSTNGAGAETRINLQPNSGTFSVGKTSTGTTVYKIIGANTSYLSNTTGDIAFLNDASTGRILMAAGGSSTAQMTLFSTGNLLINTTTDAGFRLDVNGTARVKGTGTSISTFAFNVENSAGTETFRVYDNGLVRVLGGAIVMNGSNGSFTAGFIATAGQIGAGTTSVSASAQLEISSTTRGFLPPRMTTTQKNAIVSPAAGLMVYDTTLNVISYYNGTMWI